jgi:hypothetical protein
VTDDHVLAVLSALEEEGLRTTDGDGTPPERPYVQVQVVPGRPAATSMTGRRVRRTVDLPLQIVGNNPRSVRAMFDRVDAALLDRVLEVPGRRCAPADRIASTAPDVTNELNEPAWWATATYRIVSDPTAGETP